MGVIDKGEPPLDGVLNKNGHSFHFSENQSTRKWPAGSCF